MLTNSNNFQKYLKTHITHIKKTQNKSQNAILNISRWDQIIKLQDVGKAINKNIYVHTLCSYVHI